MRLLIDGNVLLDVLQKREPHYKASALVWKYCEAGQAEGFVSAVTFANLVYVMRRELTPEIIEEILHRLSLIFTFADLTAGDIKNAAALHWKDYEDALQAVTAERLHARWLITRNVKDFAASGVMPLTPAEFLSRL